MLITYIFAIVCENLERSDDLVIILSFGVLYFCINYLWTLMAYNQINSVVRGRLKSKNCCRKLVLSSRRLYFRWRGRITFTCEPSSSIMSDVMSRSLCQTCKGGGGNAGTYPRKSEEIAIEIAVNFQGIYFSRRNKNPKLFAQNLWKINFP